MNFADEYSQNEIPLKDEKCSNSSNNSEEDLRLAELEVLVLSA